MPAFNAERYISAAIESVLAQTHKDFELIIIDDGSSDRTLQIIETYIPVDERIRVISHRNVGMGASLNQALDLVKNEWIVRMDADDVMLPGRIERQISFVEENPDIAVAGTLVYYIDEHGRIFGEAPSPRLTSSARVQEFVRRNKLKGKSDLEALPIVRFPQFMLYHPSVIMRKSVIEEVEGYRPEFWPVDDFDLWNRIIEHGYTALIQPEYLLMYRRYGSSGSTEKVQHAWSKVDWVETCAVRRRSGQAEPSWEEFLAIRQQAPWWQRLNQKRTDLAKVLYNAARSHFSNRRYFALVLAIVGAAVLEPAFVLPRLLSYRRVTDWDDWDKKHSI
jgi:glycosyltransferase involved in cell wall biosynthesis